MDRLFRSVSFLSNLLESKINFVAVDNPYANVLMIHMLAAFAQHERKSIITGTKGALQAAKRRGVILGKHGSNELSKLNKEAARQFAYKMKPKIEDLKKEGITTVRGIVTELNARKESTYRGGNNVWHVQTVARLLKVI